VFTGELTSISRDEAQDLVRRYGARVTGAPSSKTSYLVVGEDAGQSKLDKAKKLGLKTINEDELFELIKSSLPEQDVVEDSKNNYKMDVDVKPVLPIKPMVETPEAAVMKTDNAKLSVSKSPVKPSVAKPTVVKTDTAKPSVTKSTFKAVGSHLSNEQKGLWTEKYRPKNYTDVIGNKSNVEKLGKWLRDW
jgi:replication factor C subunit 1